MQFLDASNLVNVTSLNILTLGASCLAIFVTVWLANRKMRRDLERENEQKFKMKASVVDLEKLGDYVDQQDKGLHKRVNELRTDNNTLDKKIGSISEDVAWIRGFLDPSKK